MYCAYAVFTTRIEKIFGCVLRRMPFLSQPSPFIRAWDRHQGCSDLNNLRGWVGAREGDEVDRVKWRLLSRCGDPE